MDAKAINKFPIREYLASRGIRPDKDRSYCGLYHSPLREDHMPSMKVDYDKNLWIDYGAGEGGTLIDLVMHMERCDAGEAMRRLEQWIDGGPISSFIGKNTAPQRPPSIVVERVRPLENPALLDYLMERGIDLDTARMHCSEVHYRVADKSYFAVGFRNDAGGWELRNRYFKGCTSKAPTTRRGDYPTCLVFEGFMDYLSFLTLKRNPNPPHNIVVLNSVTNLIKVVPLLIEPERVLVTGFSLFVLFFHMSRFKGARLGSGTRPRREGPLSDKHRFVGQRYTLLPSGDGKCVETTQGTTDGSNPSARGASRAAILQRFSLDNKSFDRPGTASMRHTSKASEGILSSLREMNDSPPAIMR